MERRLAAIMVVDIAGYSRLMEADEESTVSAVRELFAATFSMIAEHGGEVINTAGDGFLAEFGSVLNAVRCATTIQNRSIQDDAEAASTQRLELRIGINQGEIVVEGTDYYGDGINVAARLQALAEPGGVAVSGRVHEDVAGKLSIAWRDEGERSLKNISRPVRVWCWTNASESAARPLPPLDRPSVAVLPFDNLGAGLDDGYFVDGLVEDIIIGLARFRSLFVVARNSSFAFRGKQTGLAEIGRQLGVSYLLEGSVRRAGDRVRITAQLIEAASGTHVWAERYDRDVADIFAVQDEVTTTIVSTLAGRIEEARFQQSLRKPTTSLAAYEFMLRGLVHFRGYADDDNRRACEFFERAIATDPGYALAHSYLALARIAVHGYGAADAAVKADSAALARRGVELDAQEGACHRLLGHVLLYQRDYELAEHHSRRAVELNPNDADGLVNLGYVLVQRGRPEEGLEWIERAVRLNPFHPPWYHAQRAAGLYSMRRFSEAAQSIRRMPDAGGWSFRLAACYGQLGRDEDARGAAAAVLRAVPDFSTDRFLKTVVLLERREDVDLLREGLSKAGLPA